MRRRVLGKTKKLSDMWYKFKCPHCGCGTLNLERTVTSYYDTTCVNIHDYEDDDWKPTHPTEPGDILYETTEKEEYPEPDGVDRNLTNITATV